MGLEKFAKNYKNVILRGKDMNEKLKNGIIAQFTGISFSNKEELISIFMDNYSCQYEEVSDAIDEILVDSFCDGHISEDFFNEYISDKFKNKLDNILPNVCLGRISVVDENRNVIATTNFTNEAQNLAAWKAMGFQEEDFYK